MKKNITIIILSILVFVLGLSLIINHQNTQNSFEKLTEQNNELKEQLEKNKNKLESLEFQKKNLKNNKDTTDSEIKKIKKETQACLDTGFAMLDCNYKAMDKYDVVIEKNIKNFKNILDKSQYNDLLNSQKQWEKFIELDNTFIDNTLGNLEGTIHDLMGSTYKVDNYEIRANEIKALYKLYSSQI